MFKEIVIALTLLTSIEAKRSDAQELIRSTNKNKILKQFHQNNIKKVNAFIHSNSLKKNIKYPDLLFYSLD